MRNSRKWILGLSCFLIAFSSLSGQTADSSKIILYWPEYSNVRLKVFSNDTCITTLKGRSFIEFYVKPGHLNLLLQNLDSTNLDLTVDFGKTYFIRFLGATEVLDKYMLYAARYRRYPPNFSVVDSVEAINYIQQNKLNDLNDPKLWERSKWRLDVFLNMGLGLSNFPMLYMTDGSKSYFGFGDKMGGGIGFTYEPIRYLQLTTDMNYSTSTLNPDLENAEMLFKVFRWSFTPYLVIPFGNSQHSLKFGVGKDFYLSPSLTIKTSSLQDGYDDKWNYSNTSGYHIGLRYDLWDDNSGSYAISLRWYKVNYQYKSGQYVPLDNKMIKPDGSSVVLSIGGSIDLFGNRNKR